MSDDELLVGRQAVIRHGSGDLPAGRKKSESGNLKPVAKSELLIGQTHLASQKTHSAS